MNHLSTMTGTTLPARVNTPAPTAPDQAPIPRGAWMPDRAFTLPQADQERPLSIVDPDAPPAATESTWFSLRAIAQALGCDKKTARTRALAGNWPTRTHRNRALYCPPPAVRALIATTPEQIAPEPAPEIRFADLRSQGARMRAMRRQAAVERCLELASGGAPMASAVAQTVSEMGTARLLSDGTDYGFSFGGTSLRSWITAYAQHGIDGLVEQRIGRVGRRSFVSDLPQHLVDMTAAAALEHGTLGPDSRPNMARAVRTYLVSHPDLPASARRVLHGGHASKSYVPSTLRGALRVSPMATALVQGPHAARLAAPFIPGDYADIPPGRLITADDMTANVYCWTEAPGPLGYIVGRPQVLAWFDVGAWRWQYLRIILRASGQYTRDDVWGGIGDVIDQFGLYPEWLFEGGRLWRSNLVVGEITGLHEQERFGGLESLGAKLHHSRRPQSKAIESAFNQLQAAGDAIQGYAGRAERYDAPEETQRTVAACKAGKLHPRGLLPHISQYKAHLEQVAAALNAERNDGRICRGATPDELWATSEVARPAIADSAKWMYRSAFSKVTVRRDGMLHVTVRSGKFKEDHWYQNPDALLRRAGQTVLVYWNDRNPAADACVMSASSRPEFLCIASNTAAIPRLDATRDQMHDARAATAAAMASARTEIARLAPHFQRPLGGMVPAENAGRGFDGFPSETGTEGRCSPSSPHLQRLGKEIAASEQRAEKADRVKASTRARVRSVALTADDLAAATRRPGLESAADLMSDADVAALFAPAPQPHAATACERTVEATPLQPECDGPLMGEALFPPPLTPSPKPLTPNSSTLK